MQLKFKLQGQRLTRTDRLCPVADSKNLLGAEFEFSHQWSGCQKTAIFKSSDGTAYSVLLNEDKCAVPYEVSGGEFYVSVFGVKNEMRITSDEISVSVEVSGYAEGETPQEPTQTVYEQILNRIAESEATISAELDSSVQTLSDEIQTIDNKFLGEVQSINDKISEEVQTIDNKISTEIQTQIGDISKLSLTKPNPDETVNNLVDAVNLNNKCLFDAIIYIIGNQLLLPNSDKTVVDNIVEMNDKMNSKAEARDTELLFSDISYLGTQMSNAQESLLTKADKTEVEMLQTQMGEVESALDGIIDIQNALMGNYTYEGSMPPVVGGDAV